jgi:hypothetical protein
MWRNGLSSATIGEVLDRSRNSIIGRANKLNLGKHLLAPAHQTHYRYSDDQLYILNANRRVVLQEVYDQGGTLKDAAKRLNLHESYLSRLSNRLGISFSSLPIKRLHLDKPRRNKQLEAYDESRKEHLLTLVDLPKNRCRWAIGEGNPIKFCGAPVGPYVKACGPYCETHQYYSMSPKYRHTLFDESIAA